MQTLHSWKQKHLACVETFQRGSACVLAHLLKTQNIQHFSVGLLCRREGRKAAPFLGWGAPSLWGGALTPPLALWEDAAPLAVHPVSLQPLGGQLSGRPGPRPGRDGTHREPAQRGGPELGEQVGWRETQKEPHCPFKRRNRSTQGPAGGPGRVRLRKAARRRQFLLRGQLKLCRGG